MMNSSINKRCHPRNYYKAPIIYAREHSSTCSDATMYNFSAGGMYFESDYAIRSGSYIYIRMINFSPDVYVPGAYKAYVAQVRWCRKISDAGASRLWNRRQIHCKESHPLQKKYASMQPSV